VLTTIETHPTRPELLITGSNDGHVCFWDHRKLTRGPFRIETNYHLGAIHSLKIHAEAPRFLYSCAEDGNVLCWDFHHNRSTSETAVEYEKRPTSLEKKASHLQVYPLTSSFLPWNCMDLDVKSDTIISGSDTHELVIIQNASKMTQQQPIHRIP
jgi:nuclear pore complex protein Nup43